ncbi:lysine--tRNA ligase [Phycisphaerales bacterium AB-hyl4]|uniref:Lysine--tRNA ligase n=1 Tax=Natronomicrosphaera hydrolytica TaxID=3242702 RepID=A0ABV4U4B5_9BACT
MSNTPPAQAPEPSESSLIADRRNKLNRLRDEFNVDPFGQRVDNLLTLTDAREQYDPAADEAHKADADNDARPRVRVAGRVMQHRVMGNLIFMQLRDATGDLQAAVSKKLVGPDRFKQAKLADLSDIVVIEGALATTKTGEVTVWAEGELGYQIASKSLAPPPGKWVGHGFKDAEQRYRKRYVDLYANPHVMKTMQLRIRIIDEIRDYFRSRGYLEVETPMLQSVHGGAAARPFTTHHNALDLPLYLRIAPELYLKRLLVGGMPKVFEINRNFRNEGISPRHNPEFTMLEAYEAFGSWETMAELVEDMICTIAEKVLGTLKIEHGGGEASDDAGNNTKTPSRQDAKKVINLERPWRRVRMDVLVEERTGWKFDKRPLQDAHPSLLQFLVFGENIRSKKLAELMISSDEHKEALLKNRAVFVEEQLKALSPAEQLVEVYEKLVEPTLIDPTFVTHVPSVVIPLAKENKDDPFFADVYELAINGVEISPGYTELNDPDVQEKHFRHQVGDREEQQQVDEDFLEALRVGMPPAGGIGLGIDRLVMMLLGAESIRDVVLFPLMRPVKSQKESEG